VPAVETALPDVGATIYVSAAAWASTSYKDGWPYASSIEDTYFKASIGARKVGKKLQVLFDAFQLGGKDEVYSCAVPITVMICETKSYMRVDEDDFVDQEIYYYYSSW
jgi:hypothetical protein